MSGTSILAYYEDLLITAVISFIVQASGEFLEKFVAHGDVEHVASHREYLPINQYSLPHRQTSDSAKNTCRRKSTLAYYSKV